MSDDEKSKMSVYLKCGDESVWDRREEDLVCVLPHHPLKTKQWLGKNKNFPRRPFVAGVTVWDVSLLPVVECQSEIFARLGYCFVALCKWTDT